jgi:carbon monoxide dehydrogenase subunit G
MRFEESILINRSPDEVWAFMTNSFNSPRVRPGLLGLRQTSPGPIGAGSVLHARAIVLGFETRMTMTITEWDPPRFQALTLAGRPIRRFTDRMTLEDVADGTRIERTTEIEPHWALRPIWPLYALLFKRQHRAAFANLKRMIEATPPMPSKRA